MTWYFGSPKSSPISFRNRSIKWENYDIKFYIPAKNQSFSMGILVSPAGSICRGDERLSSHSALQWPHCPKQNIVKDCQIVQNDDDLYVS